jgi:hypothetical protein
MQPPMAPPMAPPMSSPPGPDRAEVLSRVKWPAIAMMVVAVFSFFLEVLDILWGLVFDAPNGSDLSQLEGMEGMESVGWLLDFFERVVSLLSGPFGILLTVATLLIFALIFFGAMKMKKLESYGLAMTAAILSLIPCLSICCILGIPFGIWALVVLLNADVKAAFG